MSTSRKIETSSLGIDVNNLSLSDIQGIAILLGFFVGDEFPLISETVTRSILEEAIDKMRDAVIRNFDLDELANWNSDYAEIIAFKFGIDIQDDKIRQRFLSLLNEFIDTTVSNCARHSQHRDLRKNLKSTFEGLLRRDKLINNS